MFVVKFLIVAFMVYIVLTIAIPTIIGAYYGATLWKRYVSLYNIMSQEIVDKMFQYDVQLHIANHPYIRFLSKF